ncbi:MAG: AMP-binding protein, partial [Rhodobacterales bacterium]|nr:AMP-binding protein [Rhodobacterales bacterium]
MTVADDPFTWGPPDILRTGEVQAGLSARDVLDRHAALRGDQPFLIFPETGRSLTYGEARQAAARHAALLARAGVTPGDTVAFMGANGQGCV